MTVAAIDTPIASTSPASDDLVAVDDPIEQGRFTRWVVGADGKRLGESSLQLGGMHCAACAGIIEQALLAQPGVRTASVSSAVQRASVCWDPERTQPSALIAAVRSVGYDAVPDAAAPARALRRREARQALWRLFVAGFCAMQIMMFATPSYVAVGDDLTPDMRQLLNWGCWLLALPVLAFSAGPFFQGAWRALKLRTISMDLPVALGVGITFVASSGATFSPGGIFGAEVYFDSLAMFVAFLLGARFLEMRARHRAAEALEASLARLPETAWRVEPDGRIVALAAHRLVPGDVVRVPLGEAFPADGELIQGQARADEALLSGESAPVSKRAGDSLVAGSVNLSSAVLMRVQRVGADTRFEAIVSMMRSAATQRPAMARLADRWARPFLVAVIGLAVLAAAAWTWYDPARAVWVAVSVLIVTCPCALSLAAPTTIVAVTRALARRGVLVQRLDAIEALAQLDQVFFDKTGTLTADRMRVSLVEIVPGPDAAADATAALRQAAGLAIWSSHPMSRALVSAAGELTLAQSAPAEEVPGQGLRRRDEAGREWRLGRPRWVSADARIDTSVALGVDGRVVATFSVEEDLREGAAEAVAALQADGLRVTLLSGDTAQRANALAGRLGIAEVVAEALPETKLEAMAQAQRAGRRVAMVGDGVNDAPVLARADVSLAMGQGALVSRAQADAVILSDRLTDLVTARAAAKRAVNIVRQNLVWAAAYNALCIPLALAGWLPPWAAGIGMASSSLFVVLNALRAGHQPSVSGLRPASLPAS